MLHADHGKIPGDINGGYFTQLPLALLLLKDLPGETLR